MLGAQRKKNLVAWAAWRQGFVNRALVLFRVGIQNYDGQLAVYRTTVPPAVKNMYTS